MQLTSVEFGDNEFILRFDNKRYFTGILRIQVNERSIVPGMDAHCGYSKGHPDLVDRS